MDATEPDFTPIYARLKELPALPSAEVQADDRVIHRGTGEGWVKTGDV
jgi:phenylalanine-4-hydroxylase